MRNLINLFVLGIVIFFTFQGCQKDDPKLQLDHEEVVMRKIGHEILLLSNDSTSIVRPILQEGDKYRIQFESNFSFLPDDLVKTIDTIIKEALPYDNYLVQVEECETNQVVYSYEIDVFSSPFTEVVACSTREQPNACYEIIIQFITKKDGTTSNLLWYIFFGIVFLSIAIYTYIKNKQSKNGEKIKIGAYLYDQKKMTLTLVDNIIELTSKESELLSLLYASVNETVDRETILNKVWGDEGDYVGRTLDVFVSKLRKKLEHDPTIEIKNVRGIGYRLIIED